MGSFTPTLTSVIAGGGIGVVGRGVVGELLFSAMTDSDMVVVTEVCGGEDCDVVVVTEV